MGIEVDVTTRKSECYPGDVVEGTVTLTITAVSSCSRCCAGYALLAALAMKGLRRLLCRHSWKGETSPFYLSVVFVCTEKCSSTFFALKVRHKSNQEIKELDVHVLRSLGTKLLRLSWQNCSLGCSAPYRVWSTFRPH